MKPVKLLINQSGAVALSKVDHRNIIVITPTKDSLKRGEPYITHDPVRKMWRVYTHRWKPGSPDGLIGNAKSLHQAVFKSGK